MGNSTANIPQQTTEVNPKENLRRNIMALNINTFSPFSMKSAFDDSFFKSSWEDGWMMPSRSQMLQNPFKELKVSVQSGRLLVEGKHEEKKEDGSAYVQKSFS